RASQHALPSDLQSGSDCPIRHSRPIGHELWTRMRGIADWVCDNWRQPDEGIWEVRGGKKQFTFSKLMCWVALDRAWRLATVRSFPGDVPRWLMERGAIYDAVVSRGFSKAQKYFWPSFDC